MGYVKSFPHHQSNCGYIVYDENCGTAKNAPKFGIKFIVIGRKVISVQTSERKSCEFATYVIIIFLLHLVLLYIE